MSDPQMPYASATERVSWLVDNAKIEHGRLMRSLSHLQARHDLEESTHQDARRILRDLARHLLRHPKAFEQLDEFVVPIASLLGRYADLKVPYPGTLGESWDALATKLADKAVPF